MKINIFLIIILTALLVSISFAAAYGGGTGTSTDPYQIWTPPQLNTVGTDANDWNKCFKLMADVNVAAYTGMQYNIIGNSATNFTGKFDGNNHIICNFTYSSTTTDNVGLFGYTSDTAEIKNLGLEDVNIVGNSNIGGLVGNNTGAIISCYADGKVAGNSYVGGLAGNNNGSITFSYAVSSVSGTDESSYDVGGLTGGNSGTITSCHATGSVTVVGEGSYDVGGLVGYDNYGTITSSYAADSVTGYFNVGGLVGENYNSTLTSCYATGSVTGKNYVGGLAGSNWLDFGISNITFCYATGSVGGNYLVGGLAGSNDYSTLASCYATGSISGNNIVGGLVGRNFQGKVIRCYSIGKPTGASNVGGLCGSKSTGGDYEDTGNFWDKQTSQIETSVMGTKKTTVEMMMESTFTSAGWDFLEIWGITENMTYPYLLNFESKYGGGTGDPNNPYLIYTPEQMNTIGTDSNDWSKCFILMDDVNMAAYTGTQYNIIGNSTTKFTGKFNGNNHIIRNLKYSSTTTDYVGLFGYTYMSEIKDLGVEDVNIITTSYFGGLLGKYTGGLISLNDGGTVRNCYLTGSINSDETGNCIGGLIGYNSGTISYCYSNCTVSSSMGSSGGLVGFNDYGTVNSCYATGTVCGFDSAGGLIAINYGMVSYCYSMGQVNNQGLSYMMGGLISFNAGNVLSCFWDTQTSGKEFSGGGIGLTTEQMKTMSIYQNAGWADKGWVIEHGVNYPHLAWEGTSGIPIPQPSPVPLSGNGTENNPYQVWTPEDFSILSWHISILDKHIILMSDLDLNNIKIYPIGNLGLPFIGSFNGNNHTLSNIIIYQPACSNVGIFKCSGAGCDIKNVCIEDVNVIGGDCVGGLSGSNVGTINNCNSTGSVKGQGYTGGLIGRNDGQVLNCFSTGLVGGGNPVRGIYRGHTDGIGGLIGYNNRGTVDNCYSVCQIMGIGSDFGGMPEYYGDSVGGLVGKNYKGTVNNCYSSGSLSGYNFVGGLIGDHNDGILINSYSSCDVNGVYYVGGLVGNNYGSISKSYSVGSVCGYEEVGGLAGINADVVSDCHSTSTVTGTGSMRLIGGLIGYNHKGAVNNCYATGVVSGNSNIGGLIGLSNRSILISNCYSIGYVSGVNYVGGLIGLNVLSTIKNCYSAGAVVGSENTGGLIGDTGDTNLVTSCFWDVNSSGQIISDGGIGKTTAEMMTQSTFTMSPYLWDFVGETANGTENIWRMCVDGVSYPKLKWEFAQADFACPDGVNFFDYAELAMKWLQTDYGDANGLELTDDGLINFDEFAIMASLWKVSGCGDCNGADYSKDGDIDEDDLVILGQNWLRTDYGDVDGIDLTGDGKVDYDELKIFAEEWLN